MNPFQSILDFWGMAFKPFQELGGPGLGSMADMQSYNAQHSYNPFSISSFGKMGPYTAGAANVIGNRYGMNRSQMLNSFINKLGGAR